MCRVMLVCLSSIEMIVMMCLLYVLVADAFEGERLMSSGVCPFEWLLFHGIFSVRPSLLGGAAADFVH